MICGPTPELSLVLKCTNLGLIRYSAVHNNVGTPVTEFIPSLLFGV